MYLLPGLARVPDQDDSKELSGSLSRNVFERPEVGILNSWVVVFNKFEAQIFSLRVKTLRLASRHVKKKKASLAVDMRRLKTPLLKLLYRSVYQQSIKKTASGLMFNCKSILLPELLRILFWTCIGALGPVQTPNFS